VGKETPAAILAAVRQKRKASATAVPQHIERAVAEQTVEIFWVAIGVTGEKFTLLVAKIGVMLALPAVVCHKYPSFLTSVYRAFWKMSRD
jgi:hypothetical protein